MVQLCCGIGPCPIDRTALTAESSGAVSWELASCGLERGLGSWELGGEELAAGERGAVSSESWEMGSCGLASWELGC